MTQEQKAKAYDEALEWMRKVYPTLTGADKEDAEHYFPELSESEDERMRKRAIAILKYQRDYWSYDGPMEKCPPATPRKDLVDAIDVALAYLKKQKEPYYTKRNVLFDKCVKNCDPEVMKEVSNKVGEMLGKEQKPAEWSEEDELTIADLINYFEGDALECSTEEMVQRIKSLRPQPHKETYQAAKHDLATKFMNYLDENKPEGKMCLSNGECEDIDRAFKENDWAKIMRYARKYQTQSEQKPEVKHIGWVARDSEHNPYLGLGLVLFKGKPKRSGDCWTGVIDSQLPWESFPDLKWEDEPVEVEVEITIRRK